MLNKEDVIKRLTEFINNKVDEMSINNSVVMVFRPVIHRVSKKVICKMEKLLSLLSDENGMIDVDGILGEMTNNLITANSKSYPAINKVAYNKLDPWPALKTNLSLFTHLGSFGLTIK